MALQDYTLANIGEFIGKELGVSNWMTVDQERINQFADCTEDHQWIHVDVERAKRESPLGSTIAHGYLTLSLLPRMQHEVGIVPAGDVRMGLNYGTEHVRFLAPVKAGARIRTRVTLLSAEDKGGGRILFTTRNTVEIEGEEKPAMVADTLAMIFTA